MSRLTWARVEAARPHIGTTHEGHVATREKFQGREHIICHTCQVSDWLLDVGSDVIAEARAIRIQEGGREWG